MLSNHVGHSFKFTGYVKPNADLNITITVESESKNVTKNDVIILCGGTKNIGRNETYKGFRSIS